MAAVDRRVTITVLGFTVSDPSLDPNELRDVALAIRSDIGSRLSEIAQYATHGGVMLHIGGVEANTDEPEEGA